jgi:hypothetical protein
MKIIKNFVNSFKKVILKISLINKWLLTKIKLIKK